MKLAWSCPRWTRTFLLQEVLTGAYTSARTDILGRYGKFVKGLKSSVSQEVRILFNLVSRDLQSTTRRRLRQPCIRMSWLKFLLRTGGGGST